VQTQAISWLSITTPYENLKILFTECNQRHFNKQLFHLPDDRIAVKKV